MPHCVYVLQSIPKPHLSYVGYAVNPAQRLRQHNREITGGADKTKRSGPWKFKCIVTGFKTHVKALQFEWGLNKARRSVIFREFARNGSRTAEARVGIIRRALASPVVVAKWGKLKLNVYEV